MTDQAPERCDILIRNGTVVDGTGGPARCADVAVTDDRIVSVGDLSRTKGGREIDATGLAVAPGFIDVHTHDDYVLLSKPEMTPKLSQGVTTVVVGNCGVSVAPLKTSGRPPPPLDLLAGEGHWRFDSFAKYLDALDQDAPAINGVAMVGHSTLRAGAMDRFDRAASGSEIRAMRAGLEEALEAGAIGLSTGLAYKIAINAPTDEVIELSKGLLAAHGALYATHMRNDRENYRRDGRILRDRPRGPSAGGDLAP